MSRKNIWKTCPQCGVEITVQNIERHIEKHNNPPQKPPIKYRDDFFIKGRCLTKEKEFDRRRKISETMKKNPNSGGIREGSGRGKKQWYESPIAGSVYVRSTYELEYVKWLDENNIQWKGNLIKFPYEFEGKLRYYYPDFYLIESEEYIEIKGYKTEQDEAKWKEFPYKLRVLFRNDLLSMGLNIPKW